MSRRRSTKIDWSHGPVQCVARGCTTMLRPRSQRAEGEWANTVRHKSYGMCFKHWQQAAIAEERTSARLRTRWGRPEMTIRGSAATVFWPLPAEGTWLGREKRDLERWARTELERLSYRVTGQVVFTVHHGQDPFISAVFRVRDIPPHQPSRAARTAVAA
ncbi:hypothetical protein HMPREF2883_06310 [Actinomyces sp. HMSC075C01]|uniref:Uncharacterized protein n=1 Tax=Actinomyces oris TaxID=544580 RepID=A0A1Q8W309_9ACTO|nr:MULTISPECIES: hypothetical protein [Actinomyces]OFR53274.1 hypothetical protein HMPREF2883_06310 [Actinomyces sp. HMSC075C01]OLO55966.1 hypothetical protein BKH27_00200 [Actinomyces oris]